MNEWIERAVVASQVTPVVCVQEQARLYRLFCERGHEAAYHVHTHGAYAVEQRLTECGRYDT